MATPAPFASRWERAGESVNAFNGLSRGRGSKGRGGHRGGRGGTRSGREQAVEHGLTSKENPLPQASRPTMQLTQPLADKSPIPSISPSKLRPPQKSSGTVPSAHQAPGPQVLSSLNYAKSSNRRRRSQVSKNNASGARISPSALTDTQLLVVPTSTLSKDPPPHLQPRGDMRHDIDALVDRVRAVAMDNRPMTPGSHIDWAGDDDDTLPDLNDWGVNTSTFAHAESETISPIILEGLKPLPEVSAPATASPLRQVTTLNSFPMMNIVKNVPSGCKDSALVPSKFDEDRVVVSNMPVTSRISDTAPKVKGENSEQSLPPKPICTPSPSDRKPWHPSLPAKPPSSLVPRVNLRPMAAPMRQAVFTKSMTSTHKESFLPKEAQTRNAPEQVAVGSTTGPGSVLAEVVPAIVKLPGESMERSNRKGSESAACSGSPESTDPVLQKDDLYNDGDAEGLEASIHAPTESANSHLTTTLRNDKKEGNNRYPPLSWNTYGDQFNHVKQWNERSGFQPRSSSHNQPLSNGAGSLNSHHRSHASRPIITGDAMSRLARTIGQTSSAT